MLTILVVIAALRVELNYSCITYSYLASVQTCKNVVKYVHLFGCEMQSTLPLPFISGENQLIYASLENSLLVSVVLLTDTIKYQVSYDHRS